MADFKIALTELLSFEGGYSNNPADSGGETAFGISRHYQPNWLGWPLVDEQKKLHSNLVSLNAALSGSQEVMLAVSQFYKQLYWNFDSIPSQAVANKMFEMEINFGTGSAVRILQQGLVRLGHSLSIDGSLGPATLNLLQTTKEPDLLHSLRAYSALYRVHKILAHPDQIQFADGWIWRDTA